MKESAISTAIIKAINSIPNSRAIKMHSGQFQGKGEPDVFACIDGRMVVIETKLPGGVPEQIQKYVLYLWRCAGAVAISATSVSDMKDQLRKHEVLP